MNLLRDSEYLHLPFYGYVLLRNALGPAEANNGLTLPATKGEGKERDAANTGISVNQP